MIVTKTKKKEVHPRIAVEDVDVTQYDALINKFIRGYAKSYGPIISENHEDFYSAGIIGLLKAKKAYDPSRGTFVTIAFHKVFTEIHNLFVKLSKEYGRRDLSTIDQSEGSTEVSSIDYDKLGICANGDSLDYEVIGSMLSGTNRKLYWCLYTGKSKTKTRAMCDLSVAEYDEAVAELREEVLEIIAILKGE